MPSADGSLTIFEHIIYLSDNTETIEKQCYNKNVFEKGDDYEILNGNLFYNVCDLLSIDFKKIILQIKEVYKKTPKGNIIEIYKTLEKHSHLLASMEVLFSVQLWHEYDYNIADPFRCIVEIAEYIDRLESDKILQNADVFFTYVSSWRNSSIQPYSICYNKKMSDVIRKVFGEEGTDIDKFLRHLSIDTIIENEMDYKVYRMVAYDLMEFVCSNIYYILSHGMTIKRCANCGKFFVAYNRSDTLYCDRQSPQEKDWTCKEYASKRGWYEKQRKNETAKLYRNIYQQKQMLSRRNPDIAEYKSDFEGFKTAAKEWKNKVKKGEAAENDYLQWLKDVKEKKVTY